MLLEPCCTASITSSRHSSDHENVFLVVSKTNTKKDQALPSHIYYLWENLAHSTQFCLWFCSIGPFFGVHPIESQLVCLRNMLGTKWFYNSEENCYSESIICWHPSSCRTIFWMSNMHTPTSMTAVNLKKIFLLQHGLLQRRVRRKLDRKIHQVRSLNQSL